MKNSLDLLMAIKRVIELDESGTYYIQTINRSTEWEGCAFFLTNGEEKIKVFEGNGSGADDHIETYDSFINNYWFTLETE